MVAMLYPYPAVAERLQVLITPAEYTRLVGNRSVRRFLIAPAAAFPEYWQAIPWYPYAICPVCGQVYQEPADTYQLGSWASQLILRRALYVVRERFPLPAPCAHFMGIHCFFNLHGVVLSEVKYFSNQTAEVPYLTPWFFPGDIATWAVLHALPICRLEEGRFIPRYTLFALTYFSADAAEVLRRHYASEAIRGEGDREFYPGALYPPPSDPSWGTEKALYDLTAWAQRGQLGWLEDSQPAPTLHLGQGQKLPLEYAQIIGNRGAYIYRSGHRFPF
jgi:hypothetical protein